MFFKQNWGFLTQIGGGGGFTKNERYFFLPKLRGFDQNLRVFFKHNLTLFFFNWNLRRVFLPLIRDGLGFSLVFLPKVAAFALGKSGGVGGRGQQCHPHPPSLRRPQLLLGILGDTGPGLMGYWGYWARVNGILRILGWGLMGYWGYWGWGLMEILGLEVNGMLGVNGILEDTGPGLLGYWAILGWVIMGI